MDFSKPIVQMRTSISQQVDCGLWALKDQQELVSVGEVGSVSAPAKTRRLRVSSREGQGGDLAESYKPDCRIFYPEGEDRDFKFWRGNIRFAF